jgi:hypothetical protein
MSFFSKLTRESLKTTQVMSFAILGVHNFLVFNLDSKYFFKKLWPLKICFQ